MHLHECFQRVIRLDASFSLLHQQLLHLNALVPYTLYSRCKVERFPHPAIGAQYSYGWPYI